MNNKPILFLTATHGNESYSIDIMRSIEKELPKQQYCYDWVIANPKAVRKNVRFLEKDLNRSAPGNLKSDVYEERRSAEIISLSKRYSCLIDIHGTTANTGICTIVSKPTIENLVFALLTPIKRIVIINSRDNKNVGPLARFSRCPAIAIECGPLECTQTKDNLRKTLTTFLKKIPNFSLNDILTEAKNKEMYMVYGQQIKQVPNITDFKQTTIGNESFYPLMVGQYAPTIACMKMKKIDFRQLLSYKREVQI